LFALSVIIVAGQQKNKVQQTICRPAARLRDTNLMPRDADPGTVTKCRNHKVADEIRDARCTMIAML